MLEDRHIQRVGGGKPIRVDVRVVAATHRDLSEAVRRGHFREDLFYRIQVVTLGVPPLRQHAQDIPVLAAHFLQGFAQRSGRSPTPFTDAAQAARLLDISPSTLRNRLK